MSRVDIHSHHHLQPAFGWLAGVLLALGVAGWPLATWAALPQVGCSVLPAPPQSEQEIIASRIIIDGRLMSIVGASSKLSPAAFAQFYKNLWHGEPGKPLYVENTIGKWDVVAHKQGQCFYTVQVQADAQGSSYALLGISALGGHFGTGALNFPAPGDARPLTHMVSDDSGTTGDTWLLYTNNSADATVGWYAHNMTSLGWHPDAPPGAAARGTVLMFTKGHSHAGIVVAPFKTGAMITLTVMSR